MDKLKEEIRILMKGNLFIKDEQRSMILNTLNSSNNESKLQKFHQTLTKANKKQDELVKLKMEENPNFLVEIKHMATHERLNEISNAENKERLEEESYLSSLEEEINSII